MLVIDGLDEADVDPSRKHDNPVERMLPYRLPPGVVVVVASRSRYPHLGWLEQHDQAASPLDLDSGAWSDSNHAAVDRYWAHFAPRFDPPLEPGFVGAAVERAQGNLLHAVKTREWLGTVKPSERRVERLPVGLKGILKALWERLRDHESYGAPIRQGLGLLCAAGDALPAYAIELALGWPPGSAGQQLLEPAREALLEEPGGWHGAPQPRYRLFHDAMRDLLCEKLRGGLQEHHERLAQRIAIWLPFEAEGFGLDYALRFAITHRVEAARLPRAAADGSDVAGAQGKDWKNVVELCSCVPFLMAKVEQFGVTSLERDLELAARACPAEHGAETLRALERTIRQESHWLRQSAEGLPGLLYSQLLTRGWRAQRLRQGLEWGGAFPEVRLKHPLQHADQCVRVLEGHGGGLKP